MDGHSDYNGDTKSDLLWRNTSTGDVALWQMDGLTLSASTLFSVPLAWELQDSAEMGASLYGDAGANALVGTLGRDTIAGKDGNDTLTGRAGADRFVFDTALNGATNVDTIADFTSGSDTLVLSDVIFAGVPQGELAAGSFVAGAGATAQDANDRILYDTATGNVSYDADGSGAGAAVRFATLTGAPTITAADVYVGLL